MLAITGLDMIPESYEVLGMVRLPAAVAAGFLLVWVLTRHLGSSCPSCAASSDDSFLGELGCKTLWLMLAALAVHCTLDGLGFTATDRLHGHPDLALMAGLSIHKAAEGLALMLLLLGSGVGKVRAASYCLAVQSFTLLGGTVGLIASNKLSSAWTAGTVAFVSGGFVFLLLGALIPRGESARADKLLRSLATAIGFLSASAMIWVSR
jgi:zinc transporter ZupT